MAKQAAPNFARSSPTPRRISRPGGWRRRRAPIGRRWPSCRAIPPSRTTSASAVAAQGRHRDALGCFDDGAARRPRLRLGALQPGRRADGARRDARGDQGVQPRRGARAAALRGASRARLPVAVARRARAGARSFRAHLRAAARRRPHRHRAEVVDDHDARTSSNTMPSSFCYLSQQTRDAPAFRAAGAQLSRRSRSRSRTR